MLLNNEVKNKSEQVTFCSAWVCVKSLQLCLTLCNRTDCNPPDSSVQGVLQARIMEWVAMPSSRESWRGSNPGIEPESLMSPALAGRFLTTDAAILK